MENAKVSTKLRESSAQDLYVDIDPKVLAEIKGDHPQNQQVNHLDPAVTTWLAKKSGGRLSDQQANLIQVMLVVLFIVLSFWIGRGTLQLNSNLDVLTSEESPVQ